MKYISLYKDYDFIHDENLLKTLLLNRDVKNPDGLLNLNEDNVHDGLLLKNMDAGLQLLHKHVKNNNKIHIIVDSDCDGVSSGVFMYLYLKDIDDSLNVTYSMHEGKQHGIVLEELESFNFDLLITPDSGTNDVKQAKILKDKKIDILVLDHHNIKCENKYAVVINCKDKQYPNDTLAGAGVVYKFCKEYDKKYKYNFADKYLDLLALGCIGDMVDLRNFETRYLVLEGLKNFGMTNEFLKEIVESQSHNLKNKITIKGVGWGISPLINAVIRVGEQEDKLNLFRALIGEQEEVEYQPRRKNKNDPKPPIEIQTLQKSMVRTCKSLKDKQDRTVKKDVQSINEKIKEKKLDKNKILIVDCSEILDSTFTGLVANKLASQYKRPVIILRRKKDKDSYGGSCRNYDLFPIINFKEFLDELGTFNSLDGHDNAFGFEITKENIIKTCKKSNDLLKNVIIEDIYKVDYEIPIGRLKNKHVEQVAQWEDLWGNKLEEPLFAITNIYISTDKIKLIGSKKNFIKFNTHGIDFIKKFTDEKTYYKMTLKKSKGLNKKHNKNIKMNIIGKFTLNTWEDNNYPQVDIIDFNVEEDNEMLF